MDANFLRMFLLKMKGNTPLFFGKKTRFCRIYDLFFFCGLGDFLLLLALTQGRF